MNPISNNSPTQEEIDQTYDLIIDKLENPLIDLKANEQVRIGYEAALKILDGEMKEPEIMQIKGVQASAIASLTFDYLRDDFSQEKLLGVPIKQGVKPTIN